MNDFIWGSSARVPDGGDTHFHPRENRIEVTATTRLPGYVTTSDDIQTRDLFARPTVTPDLLQYLP
jgi:hypothetical protein